MVVVVVVVGAGVFSQGSISHSRFSLRLFCLLPANCLSLSWSASLSLLSAGRIYFLADFFCKSLLVFVCKCRSCPFSSCSGNNLDIFL